MKTLLIVLAMGGAAAAAPGPDFLEAQPPKPVISRDMAASDAVTLIEPTDVVAFAHDSNLLRADAYDQVDRAAQWLHAHPGYSVVLEGHTDETGDPAYNANLAFARAASVKTRLAQDGIADDRVVLVAFGEKEAIHPLNVNDRRVVLYATRLPGRLIASNALRRGALRATWVYAGSTFDMAPGQ